MERASLYVMMKLIFLKVEMILQKQRGKDTSLGGTGAGQSFVKSYCPYPHLLCPLGEEVGDPLTGKFGQQDV